VKSDILKIVADFDVLTTGFDPMFAHQMSGELAEEGMGMAKHGQTATAMTPPIHKLEALYSLGLVVQAESPLLRWEWTNLQIKRNQAGLMQAEKAKGGNSNVQAAKIDGPVSQLFALGTAIASDALSSII
jgi:phage terminase large subunit-like protein